MDPVEDGIQDEAITEHETYKVYKKRWLVLFAMFNVALVVGLHRSLISIVDVLNIYLHTTMYDYDLMTQVSMYTTLLSVLIMAKCLDYFGLRRMAYFACLVIIAANGLKALCMWNHVTPWIESQRFRILLLSEAFVGLAQSISFCVPAKVAGSWFAHYENTLALVIVNCGYNIGVGLSNFLTPIFIEKTEDMFKLSYVFMISAITLTTIVLTCVTRSSPKMPPSSIAVVSANANVDLKKGLFVMLTTPSYIILMLTLALNLSVLGAEQLVLEDILQAQHYTDSFCGLLISHSYVFGTIFMLIAAAWIDNSTNYVKVSRIACVLCIISYAAFNISIIIPNIKNIIIVTNIMASFGASLMYPALMQVAIRCANGILPGATVSALMVILQQLLMSGIVNLFNPLKNLFARPGYETPMITFLSVIFLMDLTYVVLFRVPNKLKLQKRLFDSDEEAILPPDDNSIESN